MSNELNPSSQSSPSLLLLNKDKGLEQTRGIASANIVATDFNPLNAMQYQPKIIIDFSCSKSSFKILALVLGV